MTDSTIYDWLKDGFTLIPNKLFNNYNELNLTSDEMILIVFMLCQINQGQSLANISDTAFKLGWSQSKTHEVLNALMNQEFLEIELVENEQGKKTDHYTLRPLFERLDAENYTKGKKSLKATNDNQERSLYAKFEQTFGRTLSQTELEILNSWITKGYLEDLIDLALKQALIHNALNVKYIDRILLNWTKNNIYTVEAALKQIEDFESSRSSNQTSPPDETYDHIPIPFNYWDEE